jgi:hypothetical protein
MIMRNILILILVLFSGLSTFLFAQSNPTPDSDKRNCATVGILQGGGSLIGVDMEFLLTDQLGFQLGAGLIGFGGGLNYHFKPTIRSSFVSLQYWNQGVGDSFVQNAVGATYVFRGKKWFTFQIGLAAPINKGPAAPDNYELPPVMLMYSVGAYFPF